MPRARITEAAIQRLEQGDQLFDTEVSGFGARRQKDAVSFFLKYSTDRGRQRLLTIGTTRAGWKAATARKEALKLRGLIAGGHDPAADRRAVVRSTISELWAAFDEQRVARLKPSSAKRYRGLARLYIIPALGKHRIAAVSRSEVAALHRKLSDKPRSANHLVAVMSAMFGFAEDQGWRERGANPCSGVRRFRENRRERYLSQAELQRLGAALKAFEAEGGNAYAAAAIRLLLLTGARLSEILTLRWEYVDLERGALRLRDSKTGPKTIHLGGPAAILLRGLPRIEGHPYVLPGARAGQPLVNLQKPWRKIRAMAGLDDVRLHDLRHSYASVAASRGGSLPMIGALLGHGQAATTQRYAHLAADPLKRLSDDTASAIARSMMADEVRADLARRTRDLPRGESDGRSDQPRNDTEDGR